MDRAVQRGEESHVDVKVGEVTLQGNLDIPMKATGIVAFAHGSGSSRHSPRNRYVAGVLQDAGLATLLFDLLTAEEEAEDIRTARLRFDIALLARRLAGATDWLVQNAETHYLNIGYFGASTGAAAALRAAAERTEVIRAVVSRGGRPDLAGPVLSRVKAPTLLIVGGNDRTVLDINSRALEELRVEKELVIIPGATHLFEESGALEKAAHHAVEWFVRYLGPVGDQRAGN